MSATAASPSPAERRPPRVRLRAATRRVPRMRHGGAGVDEGSEPGRGEPEPNMKLSRALVVMLLLHLVAVGGVLAFGFIKERPTNHPPRTAQVPAVTPPPPVRAPAPTAPAAENPTPRLLPTADANNHVSRPAPPPTAAGSRAEADAVRLIEGGSGGAERGTYTVGRGETLLSIAQKLRLNADALLRVNDIDDPRRIHVGQKLRLPPPAVKPKS